MQYFSTIKNGWQKAWQQKKFRAQLIFTLCYLIALIIFLNYFFSYIQHRNGVVWNDFILSHIHPADISPYLFTILYLVMFSGLLLLVQQPMRLLRFFTAVIILYSLRIITLWFVKLNPPIGCIPLRDPIVQYFAYGKIMITKDLFFSGHTALVFLFVLSAHSKLVKYIFSCSLIAVIILLLKQHAHYSADILFAFPFAWISWKISILFISKKLTDVNNSRPHGAQKIISKQHSA